MWLRGLLEGCTNKHAAPAVALTDAILGRLAHVFSDPLALGDLLMRELERRREAPEALATERDMLTAQIAKLEAELGRLADAVASGAASRTLVDAIQARETERRELTAKLEHVEGLAIAAA